MNNTYEQKQLKIKLALMLNECLFIEYYKNLNFHLNIDFRIQIII